MAADFFIHVYKGINEDDLKSFFSHTLGSKYFDLEREREDDSYKKIRSTPSLWVGEVSWLKAGLTDNDKFIPDPISKLQEVIGEDLPVINDNLLKKVKKAFEVDNDSFYDISSSVEVEEFLRKHEGERIFTVSW